MATHNLLLIPGDGIGPEVMAEVKKLIAWMNAHGMGTSRPRRGCAAAAPMTRMAWRSPTRWSPRRRPRTP